MSQYCFHLWRRAIATVIARSYMHLFITISSRFSSNSEADASELLENLEEIFLRYNMDSDVINRFNFGVTSS